MKGSPYWEASNMHNVINFPAFPFNILGKSDYAEDEEDVLETSKIGDAQLISLILKTNW